MRTHGTLFRLGLILTLVSGIDSIARTQPTAEFVAVESISAAMHGFAESNKGRGPANWSQVGQFVDLQAVNRELLSEPESCPVEAHYVFVPEAAALTTRSRGGGSVVLIRHTPFKHPTYG